MSDEERATNVARQLAAFTLSTEWLESANFNGAVAHLAAAFAAVRADEREACAKVADTEFDEGWNAHYRSAGENIAESIRARRP